jgi:hypothetical protein
LNNLKNEYILNKGKRVNQTDPNTPRQQEKSKGKMQRFKLKSGIKENIVC